MSAYTQLVTAPTVEPITLDEAKRHLRVTQTREDVVLNRLIKSARQWVERNIPGGRALITQTVDQFLPGWWPESGCQPLHYPPLQSITSVKYYDTDGTQQTWSSANYTLHTPTETAGFLVRAPDVAFESLQTDRAYPVEIRFIAGYGAAGSNVPEPLRQAILLVLNDWYDYRGNITTERVSEITQLRVTDLLRSHGYGAYP